MQPLKPSLRQGLGYVKSDSRSTTPPPRIFLNSQPRSKTPQPRKRQNVPTKQHSYPMSWNTSHQQHFIP